MYTILKIRGVANKFQELRLEWQLGTGRNWKSET